MYDRAGSGHMGIEHFYCRNEILPCQSETEGNPVNLKRIEDLCRERGTNITSLEKAVGMSQNSIRKWERSNPRIDNVMRVADYFGVTIDSIAREDAE